VKEPKKASRLSFFTSFFVKKENDFMSISVNDLVFYNYERQACVFKAGDLLHNFNGNDYRVMENYGNNNLLLMQMNTGMFLVGVGIEAYKRYPKDSVPTEENSEIGIEWGSGVYLGNDMVSIRFDKLREAYGMPPEPNERGEYEIEINETLSHTESVRADSYYDALDEVKDRYNRCEIVLDADSFSGVDFVPKSRGR
jgi:hypothetical protein